MTFHLVQGSGNMFADVEDRHDIVLEALEHGDVVNLGEIPEDHLFLATIRGAWGLVARGELAIAWRDDRFRRLSHGHRVVMRGGRLGAFRSRGDARRRGPSRLVLWALLEDDVDQGRLLDVTHHAIAKADTTQRWRRPLRRRGFLHTAWTIRALRRRHPHAEVTFTGDLNKVGRITAFAVAGLREVRTPPTFATRRYDRVFISAGLRVVARRPFRTAGDHLGLVVELERA